jgi:hypothetical protein
MARTTSNEENLLLLGGAERGEKEKGQEEVTHEV